jgi:hypothetical protein
MALQWLVLVWGQIRWDVREWDSHPGNPSSV